MLNTMWTLAVTDSEPVSVKEEPDTLSEPAGYTDLQALVPVSLQPLPAFQQDCRTAGLQDYPTITISELTSPDSSCYSVTNITSSLEGSLQGRGRKRSNSGSSGSSANSASCGGQSRPAKVRRRQPLSEEELYKQRSEGEAWPAGCQYY